MYVDREAARSERRVLAAPWLTAGNWAYVLEKL